MVEWGGLENRFPIISGPGFESLPLRQLVNVFVGSNFILGQKRASLIFEEEIIEKLIVFIIFVSIIMK